MMLMKVRKKHQQKKRQQRNKPLAKVPVEGAFRRPFSFAPALAIEATKEHAMNLWVGLGNPGGKYAHNRHNVGFMALDRIASNHGFSPWRSKFQGQVSEGRFGSEKLVLLKPETYMNNSGQSVQAAVAFYKLSVADVIVFHDEIDLAPGKIRVKSGGGHAGHNGLRSLHTHIGDAYARVRIGVGHPGRKEAVPGYVLHDFAKADEAWLDPVLTGMADGASDLAAGDAGKFQNKIALRVNPPRAKKDPGQKPDASPKAEPAVDDRTPLQKLMDKFR